jgi:hypothetical protein
MKLWFLEEISQTHRIVRINAEEHSIFKYLGDLDDEALRGYLKEVDPKMDVEKNVKMLKYFGYLHLLVTLKS